MNWIDEERARIAAHHERERASTRQPKPRRRFAALGWVALVLAIAVAVVACPSPSPARVVACSIRAVTTPALFPQWLIDWLWGHDRTIGRRPGIRTSIVSAGTAS